MKPRMLRLGHLSVVSHSWILLTAQDGMAAICLINHSRGIRMPPVPIPGGVGFMAAQRAWPQAGQSRQTLPFPHSHARRRPPAVSWPRAAHFPPSPSSSGDPGPLKRQLALGLWVSGWTPPPLRSCWQSCPARHLGILWRGRGRTRRTRTDSRKQGKPTQSGLVFPENGAKQCPP